MLDSIRKLFARSACPARLARLERTRAAHERDFQRGHRRPEPGREEWDALGGGLLELDREIAFERDRH